jgi:molybdopterin synthase catalytic subunit
MIHLTHDPIDTQCLLAQVQSPRAGGVVLFLGTTRSITAGRETLELHYEAYAPFAQQKLSELVAAAQARWELIGCAVVHRLGVVLPGEASVAVAVSAPHRAAAFEAARWLIDTLKEEVPIWKQEHWADGSTEWVHPGVNNAGGPT